MVCSKCNSTLDDTSKFCPVCGSATEVPQNTYEGEVQHNQPVYQPAYQPQYQYQMPVPPVGNNAQGNPYDVPSVLLNIISFFRPFIGLILFLSWKMEYPKKAKGVGVAALVGVILKFLGIFATVILAATIFSPFIYEIAEEIMWYF